MAVVWKINGTDVATLGLDNLRLTLENQQPDSLSFDDLRAEFDAALSFAIDSAIVLTRTKDAGLPETWFRGVIRETPRTALPSESKIGYIALGPWQWLERIAFLQNFKTPVDPSNTGSALTSYLRGRAIVAQDDSGAKVNLGAFLNSVLDSAIAGSTAYVGSAVIQRTDFSAITGLQITIPWDEVVDLSCAEVLSRALQFLPDAVCWWDYAVTPPQLNINRRSALTAITLPVLEPGTSVGDPFETAVREGFSLRERPDLQKSGVVLVYVKTNRANEAVWETYETDIYPGGTSPASPVALTRTIQLAGAVVNQTILTQPVNVDPIPTALNYASAVWLTTGAQFASLQTWWFNHAPELNSAYITIKGFALCSRDGTMANELVGGAITDWMISEQGITQEDVNVVAYIAYEETRPNDATKKARHVKKFAAVIKATNANTKTYVKSQIDSYTPPEATPVGLAQAIYNAINPMQYDGRIELTEREATMNKLLGRVLNITGGLGAWATMKGLIQRAEIDISSGGTSLTIGPPRQLGPDDLVELYRVNRNRYPVTSYITRTSGQSGALSTQQGLGRHFRGGARASGVAQAPNRYTTALTVAGTVATAAEIATAIPAAWTTNNIPVEGDTVDLTVSGTVKFRAVITLTAIAPENWRRVSFTFSGVTYYAWVTQVGIY